MICDYVYFDYMHVHDSYHPDDQHGCYEAFKYQNMSFQGLIFWIPIGKIYRGIIIFGSSV